MGTFLMSRLIRTTEDLDIKQACTRMNELGIGVEKCLLLHPLELVSIADLHLHVVQKLREVIASRLSPDPVRMSNCVRVKRIPTGLADLDRHLLGGIACDGLTEVTGQSGAGKTQLLMTVVSRAALDVGIGVIFIDTTGNSFHLDRMVDIVNGQLEMRHVTVSQKDSICRDVLHRIRVLYCRTSKDLFHITTELEVNLAEEPISLLVIDSIGALMAREYGGQQGAERHNILVQEASRLKALAETFSVAVLVTSGTTNTPGLYEDAHSTLGNTWAHCVNTRLLISRSGSRCTISVIKSPTSAQAAFEGVVSNTGLTSVTASHF